MNYIGSPFHKFRGWQIWALLIVTFVYAAWFTGPGPYGQYVKLVVPGPPLEELGYYSGQTAVDTLSALKAAGHQNTVLKALLFDIPHMITLALLCEALIAFGIRRLPLTHKFLPLLCILPIAFLLSDFAEDGFIALTLVTESKVLGTAAGIMTALKFVTILAAGITGIVFSVFGLIYWLFKGRKI